MQTTVKMRKTAKQARAKQSVEAVLEATTQLLEIDGADQISTNRIAERAGVSIGTLYQYFPNKTAIFLAIAKQDIERRFKLVAAALTDEDVARTGIPARSMMRALISSFSDTERNATLIRVLMATRDQDRDGALPVDGIARLLAQPHNPEGLQQPLSEVAAFVLTRSVLWTILTATMDAPHLLRKREFEDELVILTQSFLNAQRGES